MRSIYMIISLFILFPIGLTRAQNYKETDTRLIVIDYADSTIQAQILITQHDIEPDNSKLYFWCTSNYIYNNQGGFSGYLLHGEYCVYKRNNMLIAKGSFVEGLKTGVWKRWYPNGNLAEIAVWDNGLLNGNLNYYAPDRSLIKSVKYRNGILIQKESEKIKIPEEGNKSKKKVKSVQSDSLITKSF